MRDCCARTSVVAAWFETFDPAHERRLTSENAEDLIKHHRMVVQVTNQITIKEAIAIKKAMGKGAMESWFPGQSPQNMKVMKTSVSSANYRAGGQWRRYWCILDLRHCAGRKIVPLDVQRQWPLDIWLSYHPGSGQIPRAPHMIDWLVEVINPTKYPWFKDEFAHPIELNTVYKGQTLGPSVRGFSTEGR